MLPLQGEIDIEVDLFFLKLRPGKTMPNWDFTVDPVPAEFKLIEQPLFVKVAEAHTWYYLHALLKEKAAGLNFMALAAT